ncbi:MarR family winged helix-turn-helix transcriptional regulator [Phytohabitans houttuyneae]|uniref:MarR family transcriptional regulator n=1 Tax=Phytohabitans houttuyneae TaxID=1076126 RepID=A0A6V8KSQ9_9ACTN|nr:MarR family transcriptional regulator [Phytohabitans houttuyneae]GFJ85688.1 MarR family transcriptional regulator [Phytohabitans houttuyneae]
MSEQPGIVQTWRTLAQRYHDASCALERELHERHGLGMSEFEVLDRLAGVVEGKLRMQELGEQVHLSQSALSRAVARLERDGLVCRALCPQDRRGVFVTLTEEGLRRQQAARPTQRAVLTEILGKTGLDSNDSPLGIAG